MAYAGNIKNRKNHWIVDSGASATMSCQRSWFITYICLDPPQRIIVGDGYSIEAVGIGRTAVNIELEGQTQQIILQNVYHVPALNTNLLSVSQLVRCGYQVIF